MFKISAFNIKETASFVAFKFFFFLWTLYAVREEMEKMRVKADKGNRGKNLRRAITPEMMMMNNMTYCMMVNTNES